LGREEFLVDKCVVDGLCEDLHVREAFRHFHVALQALARRHGRERPPSTGTLDSPHASVVSAHDDASHGPLPNLGFAFSLQRDFIAANALPGRRLEQNVETRSQQAPSKTDLTARQRRAFSK
jgi:hypothetical protein